MACQQCMHLQENEMTARRSGKASDATKAVQE